MDLEQNEIYEALGLEVPAEEPAPPPAQAEEGGTTAGEGQGDAEGEDQGQDEEHGQEKLEGKGALQSLATNDFGNAVQVPQRGSQRPGEAGGTAQFPGGAADAMTAAYMGRVDPYTGRVIATQADFEAYQTRFREEQQRGALEKLRAAGVDPEIINGLIGSHPAVREAQAVAERARAAEREAEDARAQAWYDGQIREITALDPEVKSLDDLARRDPDGYRGMLGMVERGVPLAQAYKAFYFDTLVQKRTAAAQQAVRNQTAGKAHLTATGGQGRPGAEVPGEMREMYRELNPGMTDAEIEKEYARYLKQTEK